MPDKNPSERDTSIPPPPDPFPTYQTPYARSNKDDENPFIQFRRFADERFSSIFNNVPHLFGFSSGADHWKKNVEDMTRRRHEFEEGWKKELEQELEEMRQSVEKSKNAAFQAMEDVWQPRKDDIPWWAPDAADERPRLNDEYSHPKSELDTYESLANGNKINDAQISQPLAQPTSHTQISQPLAQPTSHTSSPSWFPLFGWDWKQRQKPACDGEVVPKDHLPISRTKDYTFSGSRHMDPFGDTDQTIPWLLLSPYSPIYLHCPGLSRLSQVRIHDSEGTPLQVSQLMKYDGLCSDVDQKMSIQVPWTEAFEDLLSLEQTGRMVDNHGDRCPESIDCWVPNMVYRGSLGSQWGFNWQGLLTKNFDRTKTPGASSIMGRCQWGKAYEQACDKHAELPGVSQEQSPRRPGETAKYFLEFPAEDEASEPVAPFLPLFITENVADVLADTIGETLGFALFEQAISDAFDSTHEPASASSFSTSSTSTSYGNSLNLTHENEKASSKHVVATQTATTERTLTDGSIETRRTSRRIFADGSEEADESVDVRNIPHLRSGATETESGVDKQTQTRDSIQPSPQEAIPSSHPVQDALAEQHKKTAPEQQDSKNGQPKRGGWFWT